MKEGRMRVLQVCISVLRLDSKLLRVARLSELERTILD